MTDTLFPMPEPVVMPVEPATGTRPAARVVGPNRAQVELRAVDLESLLPADHRARLVWDFVTRLDLGPLYEGIGSVEGSAGRPATDPRIPMALWLYATLEGVGSARALCRMCDEHDAYRWLCGGVGVNDHSLAELRVKHIELLDHLLTTSIASLLATGAVKLERVAQDGVRVRANAGAASFRRRSKLEQLLDEATEQVEALERELHDDPAATSRRREAARQRAAADRQKRVEEALARLPDVESKKKTDEKDKARVSTTDACARVMKMADGGFRPAYNGQFATDTETQLIVGVAVSNSGSDQGRMSTMVEQLIDRYGKCPGAGHEVGDDRVRTGTQAERQQPRSIRAAAHGHRRGGAMEAPYGDRERKGHLQGARGHGRVRQRARTQPRAAAVPGTRRRKGQGRPPLVCARTQHATTDHIERQGGRGMNADNHETSGHCRFSTHPALPEHEARRKVEDRRQRTRTRTKTTTRRVRAPFSVAAARAQRFLHRL